jgi:hypothetical protein
MNSWAQYLPLIAQRQAPRSTDSLNLMRQNNFRIFKERSFQHFCRRREATHAPHATHVSLHFIRRVGGASRDRTDDLLLAKQALSQLSYGP